MDLLVSRVSYLSYLDKSQKISPRAPLTQHIGIDCNRCTEINVVQLNRSPAFLQIAFGGRPELLFIWNTCCITCTCLNAFCVLNASSVSGEYQHFLEAQPNSTRIGSLPAPFVPLGLVGTLHSWLTRSCIRTGPLILRKRKRCGPWELRQPKLRQGLFLGGFPHLNHIWSVRLAVRSL